MSRNCDQIQMTAILAAMFKSIGVKTKVSKNGYAIIFVDPQGGRHDLSGQNDFAYHQICCAGIDIKEITQADIDAYVSWHQKMLEERRVKKARIIITKIYAVQEGRQLVPINSIRLIDGWGKLIELHSIRCHETYCKNRRNRMGGMGAFVDIPDINGIISAILGLRKKHPEFYAAKLQDNTGRLVVETETAE